LKRDSLDFDFTLFPLLVLRILTGSCPVFYPVCLFFCDVDVQLSHQRFGGLQLFGFLLFAIFASRLSSILFAWSLHARLLILAHLVIP